MGFFFMLHKNLCHHWVQSFADRSFDAHIFYQLCSTKAAAEIRFRFWQTQYQMSVQYNIGPDSQMKSTPRVCRADLDRRIFRQTESNLALCSTG